MTPPYNWHLITALAVIAAVSFVISVSHVRRPSIPACVAAVSVRIVRVDTSNVSFISPMCCLSHSPLPMLHLPSIGRESFGGGGQSVRPRHQGP